MTAEHDVKLPQLHELERELALKSLRHYVRQSWAILEPGTVYKHGWHIDAISEHLEAVTAGQIKQLVINIPPGHMKSMLASVNWPSWWWLKVPEKRFLFSSYAAQLSLRDSLKCRMLIKSEWYRNTFRPKWDLLDDQDTKTLFMNTAMGSRMALGTGGGSTGNRGDVIVVDDPLNAIDRDSKAAREAVLFWWDQAMGNRLNDIQKGAKVIIMQRLHEEDLSGHVLKHGGWEHLRLPSEFEPSRRSVTSIGWVDPRKAEGELLFPEMFPREVLAKEQQRLGGDGYSGQHQQNPTPAGGGKFKKLWFRYYTDAGNHYVLHDPNGDRRVLKSAIRQRFSTADTALSAKQTADYSCIGTWDQTYDHDLILMDAVHERLEDPDLRKAFMANIVRNKPAFTGIENKQSGTGVIQKFIREGIPVKSLEADTDKVTRAGSAALKMENGKIYFPVAAEWLPGMEAELLTFPNGAHDDWVDMIAYAALLDAQEFQINFPPPNVQAHHYGAN